MICLDLAELLSDLQKRIAGLEAFNRQLEAELRIRTHVPQLSITIVAVSYLNGSEKQYIAFVKGYETAWRGDPFNQPYTQWPARDAYVKGYNTAFRHVRVAINNEKLCIEKERGINGKK